MVTFEELGIDKLFVDEAHAYKKSVPVFKNEEMFQESVQRIRKSQVICL